MLQIGTKAPHFEGLIETGERVSLADYAGKKLVLYFDPKDIEPTKAKDEKDTASA